MVKPATQSELNQLATEIRNGFQLVSDRLNTIETKVEVGQAEIKGEINVLKSDLSSVDDKLSNQIKAVDDKLSNQIKAVDDKLSNQIKAVDEKLSAKIDGIDTRLKNVETSVQKIPDLAEKVGEFKWWKQLILIISSGTVGAFLAKFFGNQN